MVSSSNFEQVCGDMELRRMYNFAKAQQHIWDELAEGLSSEHFVPVMATS